MTSILSLVLDYGLGNFWWDSWNMFYEGFLKRSQSNIEENIFQFYYYFLFVFCLLCAPATLGGLCEHNIPDMRKKLGRLIHGAYLNGILTKNVI